MTKTASRPQLPSKAQKPAKPKPSSSFSLRGKEDSKPAFQILVEKNALCKHRHITGYFAIYFARYCKCIYMYSCAISTPTWERLLLPVLMLVPYITQPVSPAGATLQGEASHAVPLPPASRGGGLGHWFPGDLELFHRTKCCHFQHCRNVSKKKSSASTFHFKLRIALQECCM